MIGGFGILPRRLLADQERFPLFLEVFALADIRVAGQYRFRAPVQNPATKRGHAPAITRYLDDLAAELAFTLELRDDFLHRFGKFHLEQGVEVFPDHFLGSPTVKLLRAFVP